MYRAFANRSTKTLDQALCHIVAAGVIHNFFGLDDFARHVVQATKLIGQPKFNCLLTAPEQTTESLGCFLEPIATASLDGSDKLLVNLVQHGLCKGALNLGSVSYTHLRAHETDSYLV